MRAMSSQRTLVELTDTDEIENVTTAAASVAWLRSDGVSVCIDDFGTDAAAFRYLRDFRVDYVKIDGVQPRPSRR
jgi:EAL domain-containing protein (putative c-di-GMP-specific phosphodiesterase class I)